MTRTNNFHFWTALADFTTGEMPNDAIGIIARVVTFAPGYEEFFNKVRDINATMGGELMFLEESSKVPDFLDRGIDNDHEIFEMLKTAKANPNDVVYGEFHYYTQNDS